jgi:hypothetical protein
LNREEINGRIHSLAAEFVTATNLSCRQAASSAMHVFIANLVELGASLPREHPGAIPDAQSLIDGISERTIADAIRRNADRRLEQALECLSDFRFVNLVIDAGMVHHLKTIPCLLTNPFHLKSPVLLALRENQNFTKHDYACLFHELIAMVQTSGLILCSVVIDNLRAQSAGLDETLLSLLSPVIHIRCFAHMTNLVLQNSLSMPHFSRVMTILEEVQSLLRSPSASAAIGRRCPRFVRTRWFYMVETLGFIVRHIDAITCYLTAHESGYDGVPTELFELYAILLPFSCFLRAIETRNCSLSMVVPLARQVLAALFHIRPLLRTSASVEILRDMQIRFLARLTVNNHEEVLASYALGLAGRAEIRKREIGYSIPAGMAEIPPPPVDDGCNLHAYMIGGSSYDDTMLAICQMIDNTTPATVLDGFSARLVEHHDEPTEELEEEVTVVETYKQALAHFANLSDDERMETDPYAAVYERATVCITTLGQKLGLDPELVMTRMNSWLFAPLDEARVLLDSIALSSPDQIWRAAHRYDQWSGFAELALRLVSCSTSESDAERVLSMQKSIAALHGTRFGIRGIEARLRCHLANETFSSPETVAAEADEGRDSESDHSENENGRDDDYDGSD